MLSYKLCQSTFNPLNANPNTPKQPAALLDFFTTIYFSQLKNLNAYNFSFGVILALNKWIQ